MSSSAVGTAHTGPAHRRDIRAAEVRAAGNRAPVGGCTPPESRARVRGVPCDSGGCAALLASVCDRRPQRKSERTSRSRGAYELSVRVCTLMGMRLMIESTRIAGVRFAKVAAVSALAALAACGTEGAPGPFEPTGPVGRVRLVNLITDAPRSVVNASLEGVVFTVNLVNGASAPANLPAPSNTTYSPVYAGDRSFVLKRTADTTVAVATLPFSIAGDEDKTVYAVGGAGGAAVTGVVTTDQNPAAAANEVRLRIANMSTNAGAVDVFVTAAGADLSTATPRVTAVASRTASAYFTVAPGTYVVRAVPAGTAPANRNAAVSVTSVATVFAGGTGRTVVLADATNGGTPLRAFVLTDR